MEAGMKPEPERERDQTAGSGLLWKGSWASRWVVVEAQWGCQSPTRPSEHDTPHRVQNQPLEMGELRRVWSGALVS